MDKKWRFTYALPFILLAHPFLYFIVYMLGRLAFEWVTWTPIDHNKTGSGIILGILVSVVPHCFMAWFISTSNHYWNHRVVIAVQMAVGTFILDKMVPLLFAVWLFHKTGSDAFYLLAEEFPYFVFKYVYLVCSLPLAFAPYFLFGRKDRLTDINGVKSGEG